MNRKVGRPMGKTEAREQLITKARELFTTMPYEKVSTRLLAEKAQVNSAMIRYYFGSKEGLFEAMIRETMQPIMVKLDKLSRESSAMNLYDIMTMHIRQMKKVPHFPKLVFQAMNMPTETVQRQLLEKVFTELLQGSQDKIIKQMQSSDMLRDDLDPRLCRISLISLMMFPFIAPTPMLAVHGIELTDEFIDQLLEHNMALISHGLLKPGHSISPGTES